MNSIQSYIKAISTVIVDGIECQRLGNIESIFPTDGIYPYYQSFLQLDLPNGLYVMDNQRVYTPIDKGHFRLHHLVSVPREFSPLYGVTQYKYSKIHHTDRYVIIFVGCVGTHGRNRFLSQINGFNTSNFNIIPAPGVKPKKELSYIGSITQAIQVEQESSSDDEVEDEGWNF